MRKRKIMRCAAILALLLPLLLAGCRHKPAEEPRWVREDYLLPAGWEPGPIQSCAGGTLSLIGTHLADEQICLFTLAEGGGVLEKQDLSAAYRLSGVRWEGSTFSGIRTIDGELMFERYDEDGQMLETFSLDALLSGLPRFRIVWMTTAEDGWMTLMSANCDIAAISPDGDVLPIDTEPSVPRFGLFTAPDGETWVWEQIDGRDSIARIDRETAQLTERVFLPEEDGEAREIGMIGFDAEGRFLWSEMDGVHALRIDEGERTKILDFEEEGLSVLRFRVTLLKDRRSLVFVRREYVHPEDAERREGESETVYSRRVAGQPKVWHLIILRRAG